jgi:hypothetical protein
MNFGSKLHKLLLLALCVNVLVFSWLFYSSKNVSNPVAAIPPRTLLSQAVSTLGDGLVGHWGAPQAFNGTTDGVLTDQDYIGTAPVTITAWITPRTFGGGGSGRIVDNGRFYVALRGSAGNIQAKNTGNILSTSAANSVSLNTKQFVVVTRDGTTINFYINGAQSGTANQTNDPAAAGTTNMYIGNRRTSDTGFDGTIEDLRIYNRILTSSEIATLYGGPVVQPPAQTQTTTQTQSTQTQTTQTQTQTTTVSPVNGIYTVGPGAQLPTIQACADVVKAGETCLVQAGNYPERITTLKNAGSPGSPITFKANGNVTMQGFYIGGKGTVVIDGFEITPAAANQDGITLGSAPSSKIINNYIHDASGNGIGMTLSDNSEIINNRITRVGAVGIRLNGNQGSLSNHVIIRGNTISWCGYLGNNLMAACQGMQPSGSHNLVENNDISHVLDFITFGWSDHIVIRNNLFHDVAVSDSNQGPHIDGVQGWGNYTLLEGNKMYNVHEAGGNTHFTLFANDAAPKYGAPDSADAIIRYNTVSDIDSGFMIVQYNFKRARAYNNTYSSANSQVNGVAVAFTQTSPGGKVFNNIFSDAIGKDRTTPYYFFAESFPGAEVDYNLTWKPLCGTACVWKLYTAPYLAPPSSDTHGIFNTNPHIAGSGASGFALPPDSIAVDHGGPLARVSAGDSGNGTTLVVDDAGMFQDGWAGIIPDWISVGAPANAAQIASINYSANTITLASSLARKAGDPVYLFKKSDGAQVLYGTAPDIGASEYNNGQPSSQPPVQPPLVSIVGDFNKDGVVNSLDLSLLSSAWNQNNAAYDLNKDGIVNTLDYTIMVRNWTN